MRLAINARSFVMKIQLNGEEHEVAPCQTVLEFLQQLQLPLEVLLVEHNGDALRREDWAQRLMHEDDRLEVIRIVAGG